MKTINIDIETFSSIDLKKCGVYKYCEVPDFKILLFGYSINHGKVHIVDLAKGETIPPKILGALTDDSILKWAHNSAFERVCLSKWLGQHLNPKSWHCTMVWSAYMGLPLSLEGVGAVLGLEKQKLKEGKDLIRYFCKPCNPTASNSNRTRNLPYHAPDKWASFKEYNKRDVETEMAIQEKLAKFPVPQNIWDEYHLDQEINDCGVMLDMQFVKKAIKADELTKSKLTAKMEILTGLENPNSVAQMKEWLAENGLETDSLDKQAVSEMLITAPKPLKEVLSFRQQLSKSSVAKYTAMENAVCADSRVRGIFQFYGANRTGRWSGRILQPQNLPRNNMPDLKQARHIVKSGDYPLLEMLYDSVPDVLSQLIRTAFVPKDGYKFIVADFSAIEARVIAWLAGEKWRIEAFQKGEDIYCSSAAQMFGVPVDKNSPLRQKGKLSELALSYGGSVGALKAMGALEMGLAEDELKPLVTAWRSANPNITKLWWDVDRAAMTAVREKTTAQSHGIRFSYQSGMLFITLPSGRRLAYVKPRIGENRFGGSCVTYEGVGMAKRWERIESYGPKFVENIVQATARDILAEAMTRLNDAGHEIVMHIHDEVVIEAPTDITIDNVCSIMTQTPSWAKGLLLGAEGFECEFYKKD